MTIACDDMTGGAYLLARIEKCSHRDGACLIWDQSCNGTSPVMTVNRSPKPVRRVMYQHAIGPLLPGHDIIPTCGTFKCVERAHLEQIERGEHRRLVALRRHELAKGQPSLDELTELAVEQAEASKAHARANASVQAAISGRIPNSVFALAGAGA